jgi:RNA polymerase sigma-70 factor, ECF subfamily
MGELSPQQTDKEMVELALRERAFFGHIVARYNGRLSRYIARLGVKNPEDNEDVLQEIFIKVYKNLNEFDRSLPFSSWIYRIAHNEAITWYRKLKVRPEGYLVGESESVLNMIGDDSEDAESHFDRKTTAEALGRSLERLDDKYRDVLILRYFEHLEYEEISDVLKIPVGTVGTLIHRAKKKLRDQLNQQDHE